MEDLGKKKYMKKGVSGRINFLRIQHNGASFNNAQFFFLIPKTWNLSSSKKVILSFRSPFNNFFYFPSKNAFYRFSENIYNLQ